MGSELVSMAVRLLFEDEFNLDGFFEVGKVRFPLQIDSLRRGWDGISIKVGGDENKDPPDWGSESISILLHNQQARRDKIMMQMQL